MSRDGSGTYSLPANTLAVSGDPISSTKFNSLVQDLESDANVDRPIAAGGTGASTASAARTNLGLEIGTNVQAYDAGLLSIAGLTTLADRSIYTTASDTYAVYTLTAAGRAILDDADATAQRTTLGLGNLSTVTASAFALTILDDADAAAVRTTIGAGTGNGNGDMLKSENLSGLANYTTARSNMGLGTAATANTGTSGATIPVLNAANTFSALQTFARVAAGTTPPASGNNTAQVQARISASNVGAAGAGLDVFINNSTAMVYLQSHDFNDYANKYALNLNPNGGAVSIAGNTVWHANNDGAGSTLDADLLDGVQGSSYARLDTTNTFNAAQTVSASGQALTVSGATDPYIVVSDTTTPTTLFLQAVGTQVNVGSTTNHPLGLYSNSVQRLTVAAAGDFSFTSDPPGPTNERTIGFRGAPRNRQDSSYTLVLADAGKSIVGYGSTASQTWTIPANGSVAYPIGTSITFVNMRSVSCSVACTTDTMYLAGAGTTGTRTLASYGWCTAVKTDTTNWIIGGTGLT